MSIEAGKRYAGKIAAAGYYESQTGTLGLQVEIATDGETQPMYHTLWLTEKAKERTAKTLAEFGIDAKDKTFWGDPAPKLVNQPCDYSTKVGQTGKVEVEWFNGPLRKSRFGIEDNGACAAKAAALFAATGDDSVPW